jgi:single-strand DNA-binding protein
MNNISFVGNLTKDPNLVEPKSDKGTVRSTFTVAVNEGQGDDEKSHFINVTAFGTLAENVAKSLSKGQRVLVIGRFNTYSKDVTIEGEEKSLTMVSVTASAVGPDLRWATASVTKVTMAKASDVDDDAPAAASKAKAKPVADDDDDF